MPRQKKDNIDYQAISDVLTRTHKVPINGIFDDQVFNMIGKDLQKLGISVEFAMGALLTSVSALAGKAVIKSLQSWVGSSFYVGLVAPPSSGKSAAISHCQWAIDHMEQFLEIQNSMLINAPTIESLSKFCGDAPAILSLFDEGAQLFGAMGRYSNGGKEYDKALYNTLWNTPPLYTRDTSGSKLRLYDPRFNMAFATHADVTIKLLDDERNNDDGFCHRLLLYAPEDSVHDSASIMSGGKPIVSQHCLFLFIHIVHSIKRKYTFDEEASQMLQEEFDNYMALKKLSQTCDYTMASLLGKVPLILVRNAMILQIVHYSYIIASTIKGANLEELTNAFYLACKAKIEKLDDSIFIIDIVMFKRAVELTEYFNKHKIIFFGYKLEPENDLKTSINLILGEAKAKIVKTTLLKDDNGHVIPEKIVNIMKSTMLKELSLLKPRLIHGGNNNTNETEMAINYLVSFGLGTSEVQTSQNGKPVTWFTKVTHNVLKNSPQLLKVIQSMDLQLTKVLDAMLVGESKLNEGTSVTKSTETQNKRTYAEVTSSPVPVQRANKKYLDDKTTHIVSKPPLNLNNRIFFKMQANNALVYDYRGSDEETDSAYGEHFDEGAVIDETVNEEELNDEHLNTDPNNNLYNTSSPSYSPFISQSNRNTVKTHERNTGNTHEKTDGPLNMTNIFMNSDQFDREFLSSQNVTRSQNQPEYHSNGVAEQATTAISKRAYNKKLYENNERRTSPRLAGIQSLLDKLNKPPTSSISTSTNQAKNGSGPVARVFQFTKPPETHPAQKSMTTKATSSCSKGSDRSNTRSGVNPEGSKKGINGVQQRQEKQYTSDEF